MQVLRGMDYTLQKSAVSLGKFDGIHRGHRLLFEEIGRQKDLIPTIFTFEVSGQDRRDAKVPVSQKLIYSQEEKELIFEKLGIEREVLFPFTEETKNMEPEEFIRLILVERMGAEYICVGDDFHFGKGRRGNVGMLKQYAAEYGYSVKIYHKLMSQNEVISSTLIRQKIEQGDIVRANEMLGEPYFIMGEVIHGKALGRTLDMPTANIIPEPEKVLLPSGVYATTVEVDGKRYPAVTNVGRKPTVGEHAIGVETCILDFNQDIYGKTIQVHFYEFIREEKKFPGLEQLKAQMDLDKKKAAGILRSIKI